MSSFASAQPEDSAGAEFEDVCRLCSYAVTGSRAMHQAIYRCETCHPDEERCCCAGCMNVCHAGHEVSFLAFGDAFCDCGHHGCALSRESQAEASRLVDKDTCAASEEIAGLAAQYSPVFTVHQLQGIEEEREVLRAQAEALVAQSKDTHWVAHGDVPRCHFESLAKTIGLYHVQQLYGGLPNYEEVLAAAGFEWWVQVKPSPGETSAAPSTRGPMGVDLHYDKDEEMAASFELGVFPTVSTVTYVADSAEYCHPTVVLDCTAASPVGNPIRNCFISLPETGKHIAFDGRLLHGAPSELLPFAAANRTANSPADERAQRITFLVNVWIGHRPCAVLSLPTPIVESLNDVVKNWNDAKAAKVNPFESSVSLSALENFQGKVVRVREQDAQRDDLGEWLTIPFVSNKAEWGKSEDETGLDLAMWLPQMPVDQFLDVSAGKSRKRRAGNSESDDAPFTSQTYHFQYMGDNAAARLDYEDEEGEEDLMEEFEGL